MKCMRHCLAIVACLVTAIGAEGTRAQSPTPLDTIVTTHHEVVVSGKKIGYTAKAGLLPLRDNDTDQVIARMFFVAYTVDRTPAEPSRPLTFLWNGGPGSNAAQVHVVGFGPKRVKTANTYPEWGPNTETELLDNQETWLVTSDLVFVDPIGTGFSRATTEEYRDILYSDRGDTEAVAECIRLYLTRFNAWDAPLFLAGESYGTTRAMGVAEALETRRTRLTGVILISGGFNVGQRVPSEVNQALQLPMYTAAAHYHKRLTPDLQALTRDEAVKRAIDWARREYAPILARRDSLPARERVALMAELERFTGIDPRFVDERTLTLSKARFTDHLLEARALELGRYDLRMTIKSRGADTPWLPLIDPSLMPMIDLMQGTSRLFNGYVRDSLKYSNDLLYRGPFGEAFHPRPLPTMPQGYKGDWMAIMWNRGASGGSGGSAEDRGAEGGRGGPGATAGSAHESPPLRRAMEMNRNLRVINLKGTYDGSCAAMDEAVQRAEPHLRSHVTNRCYVGGHMMYSDLGARREMQRDFAVFVREALAASASRSAR